MRLRIEALFAAALLSLTPGLGRAATDHEAAAIDAARTFATALVEAPPEVAHELLASEVRSAVVGKEDPSGAFAMLRTGLRADGARVGNVGTWRVGDETAEIDLERLFVGPEKAELADWFRLHLRREAGAWKVVGANGLGFHGVVLTKDYRAPTPLRAPRGRRTISGRAFERGGKPMPGTRLVVAQVECSDGGPELPLVLGSTHLRTSPQGQALDPTGARLCEPAYGEPTTYTRTDADGTFLVTGLPQGLFAIAPTGQPDEVVIVPHGTKEARLEPARSSMNRAFRGVVLDDDRRPIPGAKVYVEAISATPRGEPRVIESRADGSFFLELGGEAPYGAALAVHEGRVSALVVGSIDPTLPGPLPFTLQIAGTLELRGRLTRADGAPYTGPVEVFVPEEGTTKLPGVRFDGEELVIPGITAPEPTIRFAAPGVGGGRATLTRKGRALSFPPTRLEAKVTLVVTGFRADGEPASGDVVRIFSPFPGAPPLELQLDEDGNVALPSASPGPAKLELLDRAGKVVGAATVTLPADGRANAVVQGR